MWGAGMRDRRIKIHELSFDGLLLSTSAATLTIRQDAAGHIAWSISAITATHVAPATAWIEARSADGRTFRGLAMVTAIRGPVVEILGTGTLDGLSELGSA
jgi:hypothetical protein